MISADGEHVRPVSAIFPLAELPVIDDPHVRSFFCWSGQNSGWITADIFQGIVERVWYSFA